MSSKAFSDPKTEEKESILSCRLVFISSKETSIEVSCWAAFKTIRRSILSFNVFVLPTTTFVQKHLILKQPNPQQQQEHHQYGFVVFQKTKNKRKIKEKV